MRGLCRRSKAPKLQIDASYHKRHSAKEGVPAALLLKKRTVTALLEPDKFLSVLIFFVCKTVAAPPLKNSMTVMTVYLPP